MTGTSHCERVRRGLGAGLPRLRLARVRAAVAMV